MNTNVSGATVMLEKRKKITKSSQKMQLLREIAWNFAIFTLCWSKLRRASKTCFGMFCTIFDVVYELYQSSVLNNKCVLHNATICTYVTFPSLASSLLIVKYLQIHY